MGIIPNAGATDGTKRLKTEGRLLGEIYIPTIGNGSVSPADVFVEAARRCTVARNEGVLDV